MPAYILSRDAPKITHDAGSGAWCSEPPTMKVYSYKKAVELSLHSAYVKKISGPTAIAHLRHYFDNTGTDLILDMPAILGQSEALRGHMSDEIREAMRFSETLPLGVHAISSSRPGGDVFYGDLGLAMGGYTFWGQGIVSVVETAAGGRHLALDFEFHLDDRYNWDAGKNAPVGDTTVSDSFMQQFHRQCYAKEYDIKGVTHDRVEWDVAPPPPPLPPPPMRKLDRANPFDILK